MPIDYGAHATAIDYGAHAATAAPGAPPKPPTGWSDQLGDFAEHAWNSAIGTVTAPAQIAMHPIDTAQALLRDTADELGKGREALSKGEYDRALEHFKYALPLAGPVLRQMRSETDQGQYGAALGDVAGMVAGGKALEVAPSALKSAAPILTEAAKAGGRDLAIGGTKAAAGVALAKSGPLGEIADAVAGVPIIKRGVQQMSRGAKAAFEAGREAYRAGQQEAMPPAAATPAPPEAAPLTPPAPAPTEAPTQPVIPSAVSPEPVTPEPAAPANPAKAAFEAAKAEEVPVPAAEPTAEDYLKRGVPAPAAALAKDKAISSWLAGRGITADVFENASPKQRTAWGKAAGYSGVSSTRFGDISAMLRAHPPEVPMSEVTAAEIQKFAENEAGLGLKAAPEESTVETSGTRSAPQGISSSQPPPRSGRPRAATGNSADGAATEVPIPGESRGYQAQYRVRELADIQPSHNGLTFERNPNYSLTNDRDYMRPENRGKIITGAQQFEPRYLISDNPDATNGPPVLNSHGEALGGNGRSMILQRVYKSNPKGAQAYRDLLAEKAAQFGLDPAEVANFKQPVLVREISDQELSRPQNAVTDFNKTGTAALRSSERAIADSRRVSQSTLDDIAGRLDSQGIDATLADVLKGRGGTEVLDKLISDGVVSPQERAGLANADELTKDGQARIARLLLGRFFRDPAQLDTIPAAVRGKLERVAAPLARTEGSGGWNLTPKIQEALDLVEELRSRGMRNVNDLLHQSGLFGEEQYSADAITLAKKLTFGSQKDFVEAVKRYSQDAAYAEQPNLLGNTPTPKESFTGAFGGATRTRVPRAKAK